MAIIELTAKNFDQTVQAHSLMLIDFWAEWCAPCKAFKKIIEAIETDFPQVTFASVDIEAETQLAKEFEIQSIPAIMLLRDQVVVYADSGLLTTSALKELLVQAESLDPDTLAGSEK